MIKLNVFYNRDDSASYILNKSAPMHTKPATIF